MILRDADRERQLKSILAQQLSSLPEPEYTYEVSLPAGADDLLNQADEDGEGEGMCVPTWTSFIYILDNTQ